MTTPWQIIKDHLITEGVIDADGTSRRARAGTCRRCHAPTIRGFDGDVVAMTATVDPYPLDALGEALAQLAGRYTVSLDSEAGRLVLNARTSWRIPGRPAGAGRFDVLAEHVCGATPLPAIPTSYARTSTTQETTCPF